VRIDDVIIQIFEYTRIYNTLIVCVLRWSVVYSWRAVNEVDPLSVFFFSFSPLSPVGRPAGPLITTNVIKVVIGYAHAHTRTNVQITPTRVYNVFGHKYVWPTFNNNPAAQGTRRIARRKNCSRYIDHLSETSATTDTRRNDTSVVGVRRGKDGRALSSRPIILTRSTEYLIRREWEIS